MFGSTVWFNTRTEGKVTRIFQLLQNAANRLILGAFKSSPVEHMHHDAYTIPFKHLAIKYHHNYIYKRLTASPTHPSRTILQNDLAFVPTTHRSPIHKVLRKTDLLLTSESPLETILPYPEPPWREPRWKVENAGDRREDVKQRIISQVDNKKEQQTYVIFTDGSYIPGIGGGAAIAMEDHMLSHAYGPVDGISNYEMEAMACMIAMVRFKHVIDTNPDRFKALSIFSDSQAALDLLAKPIQPKTLQYISRFLLKSLRLIPNRYPL